MVMSIRSRSCRRRGKVAVLTAFCLLCLLGALAYCIETGVLKMALPGSQPAAQNAALAKARPNGNTVTVNQNTITRHASPEEVASRRLLLVSVTLGMALIWIMLKGK
jgi:hypothetical protein